MLTQVLVSLLLLAAVVQIAILCLLASRRSHVSELLRSQDERLEAIRTTMDTRLLNLQSEAKNDARSTREEQSRSARDAADVIAARLTETGAQQREQLERMSAAMRDLSTNSEQKLEKLREIVDRRLSELQSSNEAKLDQMRLTVGEKLQDTLQSRLGESFKLVSQQLESVHKGLGEMQSLANGVGDLKKVLTNIKTRGNWAEVQLGTLLEQLFTADQYAREVQVNPETSERVEYAIRLPGRDGTSSPLWLPIDAKFPQEDYQRLVDAAENGNAEDVNRYAEALAKRVCNEAEKISTKYVCPPSTTNFAIMFLPTEGLYAEVLRRPGLFDLLQQRRVLLAGPTTLAAMLSSLQMGFRTLAIEKRSGEVWRVLGAVKTEFTKFGHVLQKVKKQLEAASNSMDSAARRSRALERTLRNVETPNPEDTSDLLNEPPAMDTNGCGSSVNGHADHAVEQSLF